MADVRYQPCTGATAESGGWRVAVAGRALAALPAEVPVRTVETVWKRLGSGAGIGALLEALTGAFGTSLTAIPHFAVAVAEEDGMRVAVRGPLELVVEGAHETEAISGAGVTTWVERFLPGAHRLSIDFTGPLDDAAALPIADGVVAAAALVFTLGGGASKVPTVVAAAPTVEAVLPIEPELLTEPAPPAEPELPITPDPSDAIDSVPEHLTAEGDTWLPLTSTSAPAASETVASADADEDDELWGETVARPLQIAEPAVDPIIERVVEPGAPSSPSADEFGDHDGETIGVADLRAMREAERERFESTDQVPPRAPRQGRIRLSTGRVVELERAVIIGRRPRSPRASGDSLPILIAVDSPEQDISRSHVEIKAEGEHVLITDLDTTNGSILLRGGQDPVRLHPSEPTMVISGDVVDIGDGITITFEELP